MAKCKDCIHCEACERMIRQELQTEWLKEYCPKCANNDDRGTEYCNCQAEYEVEKDIGIACIHYEEYCDAQSSKSC